MVGLEEGGISGLATSNPGFHPKRWDIQDMLGVGDFGYFEFTVGTKIFEWLSESADISVTVMLIRPQCPLMCVTMHLILILCVVLLTSNSEGGNFSS